MYIYVFTDKAPDEPQLTYVSEDTEVSVGHDLRLFCEAFVGKCSRTVSDNFLYSSLICT